MNVSSSPAARNRLENLSLMFRRIRSIIEASKLREDGIHIYLEKELEANSNLTIKCHRNCVSTYTSKYHIKRHLKKLQGGGDVEASGRRGCGTSSFC